MAVLCGALVLAGCETAKVNLDRAHLMPEPAARSVLERYFGAAWLASPHLCGCNEPDRIPIAFASVQHINFFTAEKGKPSVMFVQNYGGLARGDCSKNGWHRIGGLTEAQVQDIAAAFASLGAPITAYEIWR
jgi:outer membrane murein-binding lipoprotein Lpp